MLTRNLHLSEWERHSPHGAGLRLVTEQDAPSRGMRIALARVAATKHVDGQPAIVVNLGADMFLRRAYAPGDWDHELHVLACRASPGGPVRPTTVAGPLCPGDLLARGRPLPRAEPRDWLLIRDVGAYTLGMWSRYCSRPMPAVWGVRADGLTCLRAAERPADVVRFGLHPTAPGGP